MKPFDPRLMIYAKQTRKYIIFLVLIGLFTTALITVQTILIANAITPIFYRTGTLSQTAKIVIWLGLVFVLRAALIYLQQAIGHRAALRVISALRTKIIRHAGNLGARWRNEGNTARVVTLVTRGLDDLESYFVSFLPQLFLSVTATPMLILIIFSLDWISAIAIIFCIPLIPIFMILIGKMTANYSTQRLQTMQRLGTQLLDLIAGISTLKAIGREQGPEKRVRALGEAFAQKTMQTLYVAFLSGAVLEFLTTLSTAIVAVEVGFRMVAGNLLLFEGLVIIMLTPEVFKPLREVGTQFHASANGTAAAAKAFEILETPLPNATAKNMQKMDLPESSANHTNKTNVPNLLESTITFENISVYAKERATVAPNNLNAVIRPGEVTILRGPSGAGKSTTVQVLMHLLTPSTGQILIGDTPLTEIPAEDWWKQITWVPQRPVIVPGKVAENLGENFHSAPEEVAQAAKLTGFSAVIDTLPDGWQTLVGQGGVGLSVGQRQRLALTRALLDDKPLIILDEPSAHLDAVAEEYVIATIKKLRQKGHTVIVIAHRAALTKIADQIIDINSGTRDISAEIALRNQLLNDEAELIKREKEKIDYALPTSWAQGGNQK